MTRSLRLLHPRGTTLRDTIGTSKLEWVPVTHRWQQPVLLRSLRNACCRSRLWRMTPLMKMTSFSNSPVRLLQSCGSLKRILVNHCMEIGLLCSTQNRLNLHTGGPRIPTPLPELTKGGRRIAAPGTSLCFRSPGKLQLPMSSLDPPRSNLRVSRRGITSTMVPSFGRCRALLVLLSLHMIAAVMCMVGTGGRGIPPVRCRVSMSSASRLMIDPKRYFFTSSTSCTSCSTFECAIRKLDNFCISELHCWLSKTSRCYSSRGYLWGFTASTFCSLYHILHLQWKSG